MKVVGSQSSSFLAVISYQLLLLLFYLNISHPPNFGDSLGLLIFMTLKYRMI